MITHDVKILIPERIMKNWQEMVNILAEMIHVPAALIMKYNEPEIEVLVSSENAGNPYHTGDHEKLEGSGLYCEHVIRSQNRLLVPDASADEHWRNNPDVRLNMISYLGFPIRLPDRKPFGTLCILDNKPNHYSELVENLMLKFRDMIESHIDVIYMNQSLGDKNRQLTDYLMELQAFRGIVPICANCKSIKNPQGRWHPIEKYLIRHPEADFSHGICPTCMNKLYAEPCDKP